jgi:two-component system cell cycle sensor histidine kinase/response regulator CckA
MERPIVVLLEDNEFSANVIRRTLELAGYACVQAQGERETLEYCDSHGARVHAIIADFILPECRGTDVALQVARRCPGLPVLFVSGTPYESWPESEQRKFQQLPAGMAAFLPKPFRPETLMEKLLDLIEGQTASLARSGHAIP